jgi:DNA gyrase inhibitor GyrI
MENQLTVRIERLPALRVASALGFGPSPEMLAWQKILAYAHAHNLLETKPRFFGFNNPSPSPGSPNYGYEQWMTVGSDLQSEGDITIKDIAGGLYAVTRFQDLNRIGNVWAQLVAWVETSSYQMDDRPCLEELLSPTSELDHPEAYEFDLYLAIRE